jgi:hypothetical protein
VAIPCVFQGLESPHLCAKKCEKMRKNAKNAKKCEKMQKNAKKCKKCEKMQKNALFIFLIFLENLCFDMHIL